MGFAIFAGSKASLRLIKPQNNTVVIIGASGFIGKHILSTFSKRTDINVRVLVHKITPENYANIKFIKGDLLNPRSLNALLVKHCTVINLAYLKENNIEAAVNLSMACKRFKVHRLIHISTAVVVGNINNNIINENTPCLPSSDYQKIKLEIEKILLDKSEGSFELVILRPTAVFGREGKNLCKLIYDLKTKNYFFNYIKSCLYGRRSMNLVHVDNVVAAIIFIFNLDNIDQEVFIISDDCSSTNNYHDVEQRLMFNFGKSYFFPVILLPKFILVGLLQLFRKSNGNPFKKFSNQKLKALGFENPQNFENAIDDFAKFFKISDT